MPSPEPARLELPASTPSAPAPVTSSELQFMTLSTLKGAYEGATSVASENGRKLAYVGFAVIWVFKVGDVIPNRLWLPSLLLAAALSLDLFQYLVKTLIYYIYFRKKERAYDRDVRTPYNKRVEDYNAKLWEYQKLLIGHEAEARQRAAAGISPKDPPPPPVAPSPISGPDKWSFDGSDRATWPIWTLFVVKMSVLITGWGFLLAFIVARTLHPVAPSPDRSSPQMAVPAGDGGTGGTGPNKAMGPASGNAAPAPKAPGDTSMAPSGTGGTGPNGSAPSIDAGEPKP